MTRPTEWMYCAAIIVLVTTGVTWLTGLWAVFVVGAVVAFGIAWVAPCFSDDVRYGARR